MPARPSLDLYLHPVLHARLNACGCAKCKNILDAWDAHANEQFKAIHTVRTGQHVLWDVLGFLLVVLALGSLCAFFTTTLLAFVDKDHKWVVVSACLGPIFVASTVATCVVSRCAPEPVVEIGERVVLKEFA